MSLISVSFKKKKHVIKIVENGKEKGVQSYHYQDKAGRKTFREY